MYVLYLLGSAWYDIDLLCLLLSFLAQRSDESAMMEGPSGLPLWVRHLYFAASAIIMNDVSLYGMRVESI